MLKGSLETSIKRKHKTEYSRTKGVAGRRARIHQTKETDSSTSQKQIESLIYWSIQTQI